MDNMTSVPQKPNRKVFAAIAVLVIIIVAVAGVYAYSTLPQATTKTTTAATTTIKAQVNNYGFPTQGQLQSLFGANGNFTICLSDCLIIGNTTTKSNAPVLPYSTAVFQIPGSNTTLPTKFTEGITDFANTNISAASVYPHAYAGLSLIAQHSPPGAVTNLYNATLNGTVYTVLVVTSDSGPTLNILMAGYKGTDLLNLNMYSSVQALGSQQQAALISAVARSLG